MMTPCLAHQIVHVAPLCSATEREMSGFVVSGTAIELDESHKTVLRKDRILALLLLPAPLLSCIISFLDVTAHLHCARASRSLLAACKQSSSWPAFCCFVGLLPGADWLSAYGCQPAGVSLDAYPRTAAASSPFERARLSATRSRFLRALGPRLRALELRGSGLYFTSNARVLDASEFAAGRLPALETLSLPFGFAPLLDPDTAEL